MNLTQLQNYRPKVYSGPTSMVTLVIPSEMNISELIQRMKKETQTASNIKNNTNRRV